MEPERESDIPRGIMPDLETLAEPEPPARNLFDVGAA
jgi:hypothetical protein